MAVQGTYSDGSTRFLTDSASWSIVNTAIGNTAANSSSGGNRGLATSVAYGLTNVTATFDGFTATGTLTVESPALVSIAVTPASPTITVGTVLPFTATGTFADGSTANITATVIWSSSSNAVATISVGGSAKGESPGTVTITATSGSIAGTASHTVQ